MRKLSMNELGRLNPKAYLNTPKFPVCLVLDNIRSLHNVGSVFRSADGFGIEKIWLCGYTGTPPNPEIRKTALGATDTVAWEYRKNISELLSELIAEGYTCIAVEQTDKSQQLADFVPDEQRKYAFILGNEVEGVQQAVLDVCESGIEIPQFGTKHSLNVSVAAGILMYALRFPVNR